MQEKHTPPLGDKLVCRHSPKINTQESKHPSYTPVWAQSTCKYPLQLRGAVSVLVGLVPTLCLCQKSSHEAVLCPKIWRCTGRDVAELCALWIRLVAAFKDAQSRAGPKVLLYPRAGAAAGGVFGGGGGIPWLFPLHFEDLGL